LVQEQLAADSSIEAESRELQRAIHAATKRVSQDLHSMSFNTAIAALMELVNVLYKLKLTVPLGSQVWQEALATTLQLVAPFSPHMTEELWQQLGQNGSIHTSSWPAWDDSLLVQDTMTIAVQVNGKLRGEVVVETAADEATVVAAAQAAEKVAPYLGDQTIKKTVYVPKKLINFVV